MKKLVRILISGVLLMGAVLLPLPLWGKAVLYLAAYLTVGWDVLWEAAENIGKGEPFDECFLMAVATVGAAVLAVLDKSYDFTEAVAVMLLYQVGELFQDTARDNSRKSIGALMDLRPDYANREQDGAVTRVDPREVAAGDVIVVNPGEKIPMDGTVLSGTSAVNTAPLTGESLPRTAQPGTEVLSGTVNMTGVLHIRVDKPFGDSTASKILELAESAAQRKSKHEAFIQRFARIYTPAVCISAAALAVLPPLLRLCMGLAPQWADWLYRGLTFLIISCPCALIVSIPLAFFSGIGCASRKGILLKGADSLELLAKVKTVVFDKTGTLTRGEFQVEQVYAAAVDRETLLEYAAMAECATSHPLGKSLQKAYGKPADRARVDNVTEHPGMGITCTVDGRAVAVGNRTLLEQAGIAAGACPTDGTPIYVALDGAYAGCITVADREKPTAASAIRALKKSGIRETVLLTGDTEAAARRTAAALGLDSYSSGLLPADKVARVEALLPRGTLAFVGDGINDAPVLMRADIGIAMGGIGSDAAMEAADGVLMDDDLMKLSTAVHIARRCMRIVWENIVFTLSAKAICLVLGALGIGGMYLAVFADVGVMVLAVLNACRVNWMFKH